MLLFIKDVKFLLVIFFLMLLFKNLNFVLSVFCIFFFIKKFKEKMININFKKMKIL